MKKRIRLNRKTSFAIRFKREVNYYGSRNENIFRQIDQLGKSENKICKITGNVKSQENVWLWRREMWDFRGIIIERKIA